MLFFPLILVSCTSRFQCESLPSLQKSAEHFTPLCQVSAHQYKSLQSLLKPPKPSPPQQCPQNLGRQQVWLAVTPSSIMLTARLCSLLLFYSISVVCFSLHMNCLLHGTGAEFMFTESYNFKVSPGMKYLFFTIHCFLMQKEGTQMFRCSPSEENRACGLVSKCIYNGLLVQLTTHLNCACFDRQGDLHSLPSCLPQWQKHIGYSSGRADIAGHEHSSGFSLCLLVYHGHSNCPRQDSNKDIQISKFIQVMIVICCPKLTISLKLIHHTNILI